MARPGSKRQSVLCAVLDVAALGDMPSRLAGDLFAAGVNWIQLRDRAASGETLARVAAELVVARDAVRPPQQGQRRGEDLKDITTFRVLINKRVDVAIAADADGVHLGGDALSPADAAKALPEAALLGASFHGVDEIAEALDAGLAYGHLAPIWDPHSKPAERPALGTQALRKAAALGLPLIAQGGLDASRAAEAISAGAIGIAVTGLLTKRTNPVSATRALRTALDRAAAPAS